LSGRSSAASGAATITGVPAVGLPKMTSFVSRSPSPSFVASPLWSITANIFIFLASTTAASRVTVSATDQRLTLVTTPHRCWPHDDRRPGLTR
jgi:hypothetical protein